MTILRVCLKKKKKTVWISHWCWSVSRVRLSSLVRGDLFLPGLCWNTLIQVQTLTESLLLVVYSLSCVWLFVTPPGCSVHGISQTNTGVGCHFLLHWSSLLRLNSGLLHLLHWQANSLPLSYQGSLRPFSQILEKSLAFPGPWDSPQNRAACRGPSHSLLKPLTALPPLPLSRRWLAQLNKLPSVNDCSFLQLSQSLFFYSLASPSSLLGHMSFFSLFSAYGGPTSRKAGTEDM